MNAIRRMTTRFCIAAVCAAIAACHQTGSRDASDAVPAAAGTAPASPGAVPVAASPKEVPRPGSPGKPLPPIDFDYSVVGTPAIGQPVEVRFSARADAAATGLNVALSASEGLQVPAAMMRMQLAKPASGERAGQTLQVTPVTGGTLYLNVLVQAEIDGRIQSRSVTIPIRVGPDVSPAAAPVPMATDASGERIISLPAADR
jgi:hypothetical protein